MLLLMALRLPIAFSMAVVGLVGIAALRSWPAAYSSATTEMVDIAKYTMSVVPLFVLMGNFVTRAGMSRELYRAADALHNVVRRRIRQDEGADDRHHERPVHDGAGAVAIGEMPAVGPEDRGGER